MKFYIAILLCLMFSTVLCNSYATEETIETTPEKKEDTAELAKALDDADVVIAASVKNVVNGKVRNYAVLEISEKLKGTQSGKLLYVGFDPASQGSLFETGKNGLWMLDFAEEASYLTLVEGESFKEDFDTKKVAEILEFQNSLSPDDIEFTIKTDKTEYAIDEPIRVEMTIRNKGTKSVTFDNALLWKFTHNYSLTLETESGADIIKTEKPSGGVIGEFPGPHFVRLSPGETKMRAFNLIRLIVGQYPEGTSPVPQLPKCKASLAVTWNTKNLKEFFPEAKASYAIESTWTSPEVKFEVAAKEAELPEEAVKEMEKKSGVANLLEGMASDNEKTFKQAEDAFVEYAVPALEPDLRLMLRSDNPIIREAAGRAFLWLARHPKLMASDALLEYLSESGEITDTGAYNQVLSFVASAAIRQSRKEYVAPLASVLESENVTIIVKKEVVSALSAITGLELSEENFDETTERVRKWIENPEEEKNQAKEDTEKTEEKEKEN